MDLVNNSIENINNSQKRQALNTGNSLSSISNIHGGNMPNMTANSVIFEESESEYVNKSDQHFSGRQIEGDLGFRSGQVSSQLDRDNQPQNISFNIMSGDLPKGNLDVAKSANINP